MKHTILKNRPQGFRATGIVIESGKILLMRQIFNGKEFYTIPGGTWEEGETLEETCQREVYEEFNIQVAARQLVFMVDSPSRLNFVFLCEFLSGSIALGGPEKERMNKNDQYFVEWKPVSQVKDLNITPAASKEALLEYLANPSAPIFIKPSNQKLNKNVLIVSTSINKTPPETYGGIERIAAQAYGYYVNQGYQVDVVSLSGSKLNTYSHQQIDEIDLKKYRLIISYCYDQEILKRLDRADATVYVILQNNYSSKLGFLTQLKHSIPCVLSEAQQSQYCKELGVNFPIIPNGVDTGFYKEMGLSRKNAIAYIGAIGQHKSPQACLDYAIKNDLEIDFYGPDLFREEEFEYRDKFYESVKKYPKAKILGEVNDVQKLKILNSYKYFIFLPGLDKTSWIEPFGIAPLEAMACGCTVITQRDFGGHISFCTNENTVSYLEAPFVMDPKMVAKSVLDFDSTKVFKLYYPI